MHQLKNHPPNEGGIPGMPQIDSKCFGVVIVGSAWSNEIAGDVILRLTAYHHLSQPSNLTCFVILSSTPLNESNQPILKQQWTFLSAGVGNPPNEPIAVQLLPSELGDPATKEAQQSPPKPCHPHGNPTPSHTPHLILDLSGIDIQGNAGRKIDILG